MNDEDQPLLTKKMHFLSRREFFIWIIAIGITIIFGFLSRGTQWAGDVGILVTSINTVASMFALGFPIFSLTGLMFASPTSRRYLQQLSNQGMSDRRFLLFRYAQCLVLVGIYSIVTTIIIFVIPVIQATSLNYSISLGYFVYIPAVMIASLIVGCILAALATLLTMATDRAYLSASLGSTMTIFLALVTGWTAYILRNSVTQILTLSSPHNLVKMLAAVLSNYDFSLDNRELMYFGFNISPESLLVPLFGFTLLAIASIILSLPILRVNMNRWLMLGMIGTNAIWEQSTELHDPRIVVNARKKLRFQRTAAVFFVCTLLFSFGFGSFAITQVMDESSSTTLYQSPDGGQSIALGVWLIFEFELQQSSSDLSNRLRYRMRFEDWGSCPDELSYTHAFLMMEQSEFNQLNESSKLELCDEPENITRGEIGAFSAGSDIGEQFGTHIVVFYVYATTNSTAGGALQVSIEIVHEIG